MIFYFYPNVYEKKSTAYIYNLIPLIPNTIWQQQVYASQYFLNILFDRFSTGWIQFNMFLYTSCAKSCSSQNCGFVEKEVFYLKLRSWSPVSAALSDKLYKCVAV